MKIFYLLIPVFSLLLIGCSSTYRISDFPSKEKYYSDFNNFAKSKSVKVILTNDSSFVISSGAKIEKDTLYYFVENIITGNKKIALSEIMEIIYTSNDYKSASILLKNGESYRAKEIKHWKDSIEFSFVNEVITLNSITSINNIREINYKNRWQGIFPGVILGVSCGGVLGLGVGYSQMLHSNNSTNDAGPPGDYAIWGVIFGAPVGIIAGWLIGNNYSYQFNP
ncbi:MAG: hypothetical protein WCA84_12360 [Ignavibacteriaceae bacterium]